MSQVYADNSNIIDQQTASLASSSDAVPIQLTTVGNKFQHHQRKPEVYHGYGEDILCESTLTNIVLDDFRKQVQGLEL